MFVAEIPSSMSEEKKGTAEIPGKDRLLKVIAICDVSEIRAC